MHALAHSLSWWMQCRLTRIGVALTLAWLFTEVGLITAIMGNLPELSIVKKSGLFFLGGVIGIGSLICLVELKLSLATPPIRIIFNQENQISFHDQTIWLNKDGIDGTPGN